MTAIASGPSRRSVIVGTGIGACALGLAACGSTGSEPAAVQESADAPLAPVADVPVGGALAVTTVDGLDLLLTQPVEGEFRAFSATCTHQGCTVLPDDGELRCPCHASTFALEDAAVLSGPAPEALASIPVVVESGDVYLG
ncbi:Rieske (2Fe-2S) protein [Paraoerskovia marina]|nr:Rieske (2Fe-2S) protein [Paraoerskovia marina]